MKKLLFLLFLLCVGMYSYGQTIYVNASASGANDGTSWTDAYTDLQSALPNADASKPIWVAAGTYKPHATDRTVSFNVLTQTKLYGGFNGTETTLEERDPRSNPTILSGDLAGDDNETLLENEPTRQDNSYHVVKLAGLNLQNIIIDGFTISDGNANGTPITTGGAQAADYRTRGAAVYSQNWGTGFTITADINNCILENNTGESVAVYSHYFPSGITSSSAYVDFATCIVRNNYSRDLNAMFYSGNAYYSLLNRSNILNSLFYNNTSASEASCIYAASSTFDPYNNIQTWGSARINVVNCTFANNSGVNGKVIRVFNGDNLATFVRNSILYDNGSAAPYDFNGVNGGVTVQNSLITDPMFVDPMNHNYAIQCGSDAQDTGNDSYISLALDVAGNDRKVSTVDMGAFEFYDTVESLTAKAKDIIVQLDETGNVTITPEDVNDGSSNICGGSTFTLSLDLTAFSCSELGVNQVTLTATDDGDASQSTTTANVTVLPFVSAQNLAVSLDETGNVSISPEDVDNNSATVCSLTPVLSLDVSSFSCADLGDNEVILSLDDGNGNVSTATAIISVSDDSAPEASAQDITAVLDQTGKVTVSADAVNDGSTDNCSTELTFDLSQTTFTCEDIGENQVTLTVTDDSGNESTATATITVQSFIADQVVEADEPGFCPDGSSSTTISIESSQENVYYYLRNSSDDSVVDGPIAGTGNGLSFNTGTISETSTFNVFANFEGDDFALDFDGVNDYLEATIAPEFDYSTGFTMEAWVKSPLPGSNGGYLPVFFLGDGQVSDVEVYIQQSTNYLVVVFNRGKASGLGGISYPIPPNDEWFHLAVTYDGSSLGVWYDGVAQHPTDVSNPPGALTKTSSSVVNIGYIKSAAFLPAWGSKNLLGQVDEVRIWDYARSESQIVDHQSTCLGGTEDGLEFYFKMDEGSGTEVANSSGMDNASMINMDAATDWVESGTPLTCGAGCDFQLSTEVTIGDQEAPSVIVQDIELFLDDNGQAVLEPSDVDNGTSDNCTASGDLMMSLDVNEFDCSHLGDNAVVLTVVDLFGNEQTANANVTISDNHDPVVLTQNIEIRLDETNSATITAADVDAGSSDNCSISTLSLDKDSFSDQDIGENTITLSVTDVAGNIATGQAIVTILPFKMSQSITFSEIGDQVYGTADISLTASSSSELAVSIELISGPAEITDHSLSITGTGTVVLEATQAGNDDYLAADPVQLSFEITPAPLTITADSYQFTYGDVEPEFAYQTQGWVNDEDVSVLQSLPDIEVVLNQQNATSLLAVAPTTDYLDAGNYELQISGAAAANYAITYENGSLTIEQALLTVTADSHVLTYGDETPALSYTMTGFVHDQGSDVLNAMPVASVVANEAASAHDVALKIEEPVEILNAGNYTVMIEGGEASNYEFEYITGSLTINKADQSITVIQPEDRLASSDAFVLDAASSAQLSLNYQVTGPASISEGSVTLTGETGLVSITLSQEGNENYNSAESTTVSFYAFAECSTLMVTATEVQNVRCFGQAEGSIHVAVTGGNVPYTLDWSNDVNAEINSGLTAGNYTLLVTDDYGCETTMSTIVAEPEALVATAVISEGNLQASAEGGLEPYSYSLDGESFQSESLFENLVPGSYSVTVLDANGCSVHSDQVTVEEVTSLGAAPVFSLYPNPTADYLYSRVMMDVQIFDIQGSLVYSERNTEKIDMRAFRSGAYMVIATDHNGHQSRSRIIKKEQ